MAWEMFYVLWMDKWHAQQMLGVMAIQNVTLD